MFQTDQSTAVSSIPTPAAAGTPGYFTDGNPAEGQPATIVDNDWLNMIQQELINVVEAGGETPSKTTYNQVLTAIKALGIMGQLGAQPHGQCRLSVASTTSLLLSPYNGNNVIVNGVPLQIPAGGVTVSNSGLAASTLYYAYLGGTTASPTLALSTTGHTTQSNGITTQTGNAALTLVGMIYTNASSQFVDSVASRTCLNFFNRRALSCSAANSSFTFTNTTIGSVAGGLNLTWLTWGDESTYTGANGNVSNSASGAQSNLQLYVDAAVAGASNGFTSASANYVGAYSSSATQQFTEGVHTSAIYGSVSSGTATCNCQTGALIRG